MIIVWHAKNLDATSNYNIFLSNFFAFIRILRFRLSLVSQDFLGFLVSTTYLPVALHYRGSYVRNKDDAGLLTMCKYRQFFAISKKQAKIEK